MAQSQNQPLYWDKDRVPVNLTLFLALIIALWGLGDWLAPELVPFGAVDSETASGQPLLIILLGIGVAVYTWLMTPRQYLVYADALCIVYGRPRVKALHFRDIAEVELGSVSALDRLRVRPHRGRRQSIRVREVESFYEQLQGALNAFRSAHPEYGTPPETDSLAAAPADAAAADPEPANSAAAEPANPAAPEPAADNAGNAETESKPESQSPSGEESPPEHRPIY